MTTNPSSPPAGAATLLPAALTIKDIITIISVAVSLTLAWGVFSTRIAIVEKEILIMQATAVERQVVIDRLTSQVRRLESHDQDNELFIDQLFGLMRKPTPVRHSNQ
jgi:hypothetical protein